MVDEPKKRASQRLDCRFVALLELRPDDQTFSRVLIQDRQQMTSQHRLLDVQSYMNRQAAAGVFIDRHDQLYQSRAKAIAEILVDDDLPVEIAKKTRQGIMENRGSTTTCDKLYDAIEKTLQREPHRANQHQVKPAGDVRSWHLDRARFELKCCLRLLAESGSASNQPGSV